jgi:hypothetical protein
MNIKHFFMVVYGIIVTWKSCKKGGQLLSTASKTILELQMVFWFNFVPLILVLHQAKVCLSKQLVESDASAAIVLLLPTLYVE